MSGKSSYENWKALIEPKKSGNHDWFLLLLDDEKQRRYEEEHVDAVMQMLRILHIRPHKKAVKAAKEEIARLEKETDYAAVTCFSAAYRKEKYVSRKTFWCDFPRLR